MTQLKQNKAAYHSKTHALTKPFGLMVHCVSDTKTILSVRISAKTLRELLVSSVHSSVTINAQELLNIECVVLYSVSVCSTATQASAAGSGCGGVAGQRIICTS